MVATVGGGVSLVQASKPLVSDRFDHKAVRVWNFCQLDKQKFYRDGVFSCIAGGAALGCVIGNELGRKIEGLFQSYNGEDVDEENNHLGGFLGKVVGGAIGGVVGLCGGVQFIENVSDYQNWITASLEQVLKNVADSNYNNDAILQHFCCPIWVRLMYDPVHTSHGYVYDLHDILKCERNLKGEIIDPQTRQTLRPSELIRNYEMSFVIWKRIGFLMKSQLQNMSESEEKTCLRNTIDQIELSLNKIYNHARDLIETRRKYKTVSSEMYKQEISEFEKLFGIDENQDLDWNQDWKSLLVKRWQYFNPNAKIYF
jgi:hypothetical protein